MKRRIALVMILAVPAYLQSMGPRDPSKLGYPTKYSPPTDKWAGIIRERRGLPAQPPTDLWLPKRVAPAFTQMSSISLLWGGSVKPEKTRKAKDGSYYAYKFETSAYKGFVKQGKDGRLIQCRKNKKGKTVFECWMKTSYGARKLSDAKSKFKELDKAFSKAKKV